jgi:hypothetical protein
MPNNNTSKVRIPEKLADIFSSLFAGRNDMRVAASGNMVLGPVTAANYLDHLEGMAPLGIIPIVNNGCRFCAIGLDQKDKQESLAICQGFQDVAINSYRAKSKADGHQVFVFFNELVDAGSVYKLCELILEKMGVQGAVVRPLRSIPGDMGHGGHVDLPLFGRERQFVDPDETPIPPLKALKLISRYDGKDIDNALAQLEEYHDVLPVEVNTGMPGGIAAAVSSADKRII